MSLLGRLCVWITVFAVFLAGPAASLAECLRCPPDCPMHAPQVEREHDAAGDRGDGHDHHAHQAGAAHDSDAGLHTTAPHATEAHATAHDDAHHAAPGTTADHAAHHADADDEDCHRGDATPAAPGDGPCISGVCGHMDVSIARVLPEGVLGRPDALAPELAAVRRPVAPDARPSLRPVPPPTEPPRSLLA